VGFSADCPTTIKGSTAPEEKKEMNGSLYLSAYHKITG
jgi:hypothetical protein